MLLSFFSKYVTSIRVQLGVKIGCAIKLCEQKKLKERELKYLLMKLNQTCIKCKFLLCLYSWTGEKVWDVLWLLQQPLSSLWGVAGIVPEQEIQDFLWGNFAVLLRLYMCVSLYVCFCYLSVSLNLSISVLYICLNQSICLSVCLSVRPFINLSIHLSARLSFS